MNGIVRKTITERQLMHYRNEQVKQPTISEISAMMKLDELKISYYFQMIVGYYIVDFIGKDRNFILEIDGSAHDGREEHDTKRDRMLTDYGFNVYRLSNEDITKENIQGLYKPYVGNTYMKLAINKINKACGNNALLLR